MRRLRGLILLLSLGTMLGAAGGAGARLWASLPALDPLLDYRPALPTLVLDRRGEPIAEFAEERRQLVELAEVPLHVRRAVLAAEDARFYEHHGVDPLALVRAAWVNLRAGGRVVQGGSTITQQLAKTLLAPERTLRRKVRDLALALSIERALEKDRILEIYLNEIYLGNGAYGIAQAARSYFDADVRDLSVSQAALLAGIIKAPSAYAPTVDPEAAELRRRYTLDQMRAAGWLDVAAWGAAVAERPVLQSPPPPSTRPGAEWVVEEVRRSLGARLGRDRLLRGGLVVKTTLDPTLQQAADAAVRAGVEVLEKRHPGRRRSEEEEPSPIEGALVAVEVASGEVLALVGGRDFGRSQFDRALLARRQPGSAFKPFVYGAALEKGFPLWGTLYDVQVRHWDGRRGRHWTPRNAGGSLRGAVSMEESFSRSLNNASIRLLIDVGVEPVVDFARRAGIRAPLAEDLGLALGTSGVSLAELVGAYATFAAGGTRRPPHVVRRVVDRDGAVVLEDLPIGAEEGEAERGAPREGEPAVSPVDAYLVTHLLRGPVRHWYGTGHRAARLGPVAGKTGSTNENRDAWFVGFSPTLAAGVWVGRDRMEPLGPRETGGRAALPIWIDFMEAALGPDAPIAELPAPDGVGFGVPREDGIETSRRLIAGFQPYALDRPLRNSRAVPIPRPKPPPEPEAGGEESEIAAASPETGAARAGAGASDTLVEAARPTADPPPAARALVGTPREPASAPPVAAPPPQPPGAREEPAKKPKRSRNWWGRR